MSKTAEGDKEDLIESVCFAIALAPIIGADAAMVAINKAKASIEFKDAELARLREQVSTLERMNQFLRDEILSLRAAINGQLKPLDK